LQLLALLVSAAALLILAGPLRIPYPILLVLGGLLLGFAPGVPKVTMPPQVVLVGILPPLLYVSAYFTSLRELRRDAVPISLLAIGLVTATMLGVAAVALLLAYEHSLVRPGDLRRLDTAFFTMNGVISVVFAAFVILDAVS
jgi:NhaP-type Na+/H+ or K+/H+ antiporter